MQDWAYAKGLLVVLQALTLRFRVTLCFRAVLPCFRVLI